MKLGVAARRVSALLLLLGLVCSAAMSTESPRAALDFFRGEWTIKGSESSYTESCIWLPGNGFIVCRAEDRSETQPSFSMSVFGYSEADDQYTYNGYGSSGTQRTMRGNRHEGIWRFHGQSERGPNWRRWQVTMTPTPEGFHFREEVSDRSGPWKVAVEFTYVRKAKTTS